MGILEYLQQTLGARVTSAARDPNSALGRANPRSYHNIGQAVDVAPIPGMTFDQYVQNLKGQGFPIVEAIDEVNHPSKHATGPHWHIAYGKGQQQPMMGFQPTQPPATSPEEAYRRMIEGGGAMNLQDAPMSIEQNEPIGLAGILNTQGIGQAPEIKPRAFDKGGKGWIIAGIIADAIAGGFGGKGGFAPAYSAMQQDERDHARRLEEHRQLVEERRQERLSAPYRFQNNNGDVVQLDPNGGTSVLYADPHAKPDWTKIENPDGSIEMRQTPNTSRPSTQHIQALIANPERAAEFDAKFGSGMAAYILRGR